MVLLKLRKQFARRPYAEIFQVFWGKICCQTVQPKTLTIRNSRGVRLGDYFFFKRMIMSIIFIANPAMPIMTRQNVNNSM